MLFLILFVAGVAIFVLANVAAWEGLLAVNDSFVWILLVAVALITLPIAKWWRSRSNDSGSSRYTYDTRSDADRAYDAAVKESENDDE